MMPQTVPVRVILRCLPPRWRWCVAWLVGLAWSLGLVSGVPAAMTWTVCASGCDYSSIKAAIAAPTTLDGDTLAIAAGTYTERWIQIEKSLTLQGKDAASTIIQAVDTPDTATPETGKFGVFYIGGGVTVTIRNLTIRHGNTVSAGGGLFNYGTVTLTACTVSDNSAGGGSGLANYGRMTLINSTVSGNVATHNSGGIYNWFGSTLTLINSTVSGNAAPEGGGLFNNFAGVLTLINSTVSGNSATRRGGGLFNDGTLTLTNSLVANNLSGGDCQYERGSITSQGYNLDSDGSCQLIAPTDLPRADPRLGPLQDNGGPTFTHALLPGSPAMDAIPWDINGCGTTLVGDQRWQARPDAVGGACDIGAYEVEVDGQALGAWVTGFTPHTVVCQNVTTVQVVTLSDPVSPWDCEAAGLGVTSGDRVTMHVRGRIKQRATDIGGAVSGMAPTSGGCTNLTTGQQVTFQHMVGATAGSCGAAGLVIHRGDQVQISVQGTAE